MKNCSLSVVLMATDQKPMSCDVMLSNMTFLVIFFCGFWSDAVNTMDKLQFLIFTVTLNIELQIYSAQSVYVLWQTDRQTESLRQ